MAKARLAAIFIPVIVATFLIGGFIGQRNCEPPIEYVTVEEPQVEVVTEVVTIETEKIVEKVIEVPVEVEVEVPIKLREFESTDELEEWLEENYIDHAVMMHTGSKPYDCDDYARRLYTDAMKDGYQMWVQIEIKKNVAHAVSSVFIQGKCYFIEPQTDEYWYVADVD